jgi:hypothetical protein
MRAYSRSFRGLVILRLLVLAGLNGLLTPQCWVMEPPSPIGDVRG